MKRLELAGLAALLAIGSFLLVGGLLVGGNGRVRAVGDSVDLLFMSAQGRTTVSPLDFCTGTRNPPIHGAERAIDVTGDNVGSLCHMGASSEARLRAWGWGSQAYHHTMGAWASGQASPTACDIIMIGLKDVQGGLHGELKYMHHNRTVSSTFQMEFYSAPPPYGAQYGRLLGYTTDDSECSASTPYHVHQGTTVSCMDVNQTFTPSEESPVWDFWSYINVVEYTEGVGGCDS